MAASTSGNPVQGGLSRMAQAPPVMSRPKRSNSGSLIDQNMPRSHDARDSARSGLGTGEVPDLFTPSTLGEHLLETTYLSDVVKPLVRALVYARMTTQRGQSEGDQLNVYTDLERLRTELQRSAQRRRNIERERDDLARRLDRVVGGDPGLSREAGERGGQASLRRDHYRETSPAPGRSDASTSHFRSGMPPTAGGSFRTSPSLNPIRPYGELSGGHADQIGGMPPPLRSPQDAHRDAGYPSVRPSSPRAAFSSAYDRRPPYGTRGPSLGPTSAHGPPPPLGHDVPEPYPPGSAYADDYYAPSASTRSIARNHAAHPSAGPHAPPPGSYGPPHAPGPRAAGMGMPPYASPRTSNLYGPQPYDSPMHGEPDHDLDMAGGDGPRKYARMHVDSPMRPPSAADRSGMLGGPMLGSADPLAAPTRKLAATKNRTCSNCAAPHDAKFRRGPNGPGTLCDRCGSRWKKHVQYKENEAAMQNAPIPMGEHLHDSSEGASRSHSGQRSGSRSPPPSGGANFGHPDRDDAMPLAAAHNHREHGNGTTPQHRQRLPPHLPARNRDGRSHSPGRPAADGAEGPSAAAHNGKRESASQPQQRNDSGRREPSSSPDQLDE